MKRDCNSRRWARLTSGRHEATPRATRRLLCEQLEERRLLAVLTVTTLEDRVDFNDGRTSLREAVFAAGIVPGADEITFAPALFASGPQTLLLTGGEIQIADSVTIAGPGAALLTIDASGSDPTPDVNNGDGSRAFRAGNSAVAAVQVHDVALRDLAITGGDAAQDGGAILSYNNLELNNCVVSGNSASNGGAIAGIVSRQLTMTNTIVTANTARRDGGGMRWQGGVSIVGSTISRNVATGYGGGALLNSSAAALTSIQGCLVDENTAHLGAGLYLSGRSIEVADTTVTRNVNPPDTFRPSGGGLYLQGQATLMNCIVTGNSSSQGGGIYSPFAPLVLVDSHISDNHAAVGAGIYSLGTATVTGTRIERNRSDRTGGGIIASQLILRRSVVHANSAGVLDAPRYSVEGGYYSTGGIGAGSLLAEDSTISDNFAADYAGGISVGNARESTIANCTITGNSANRGAGVGSSGFLWIQHSTITGNHAITNRGVPGQAGGVWSDNALRLRNSIVAGNDATGAYPDLRAVDAIVRFSLVGDNGGLAILPEAPLSTPDERGNLVGGALHGAIDPLLSPLADHGGPMLTHALLPGSPAIGAGSLDLPPGAPIAQPEFDQRGAPFTRIAGERIDMGAVEFQAEQGALGADFNFDGRVDGADFVAWQRNLGRTGTVTVRHGDATADGDVDRNDLLVWQARAGEAQESTGALAEGSQAEGQGIVAIRAASTQGASRIMVAPSIFPGSTVPRTPPADVRPGDAIKPGDGANARRGVRPAWELPQPGEPGQTPRRGLAPPEAADPGPRASTPWKELVGAELFEALDAAFTRLE